MVTTVPSILLVPNRIDRVRVTFSVTPATANAGPALNADLSSTGSAERHSDDYVLGRGERGYCATVETSAPTTSWHPRAALPATWSP